MARIGRGQRGGKLVSLDAKLPPRNDDLAVMLDGPGSATDRADKKPSGPAPGTARAAFSAALDGTTT